MTDPVRPTWNAYFLDIAHAVALRSDCIRASVGAVIVDTTHRVVGTGYVGTAPGEPGCLAGHCPRAHLTHEQAPSGSAYDNCISFHAEVNALLHSDHSRHQGSTIYVTREPCHWCYKAIKAASIAYTVYADATTRLGYHWIDMHDWRATPNG